MHTCTTKIMYCISGTVAGRPFDCDLVLPQGRYATVEDSIRTFHDCVEVAGFMACRLGKIAAIKWLRAQYMSHETTLISLRDAKYLVESAMEEVN